MTQDAKLGYDTPLTSEALHKMRQAKVYPIGCQDQLTMNERGHVIPKNRVTHDLSFNRR